MRSQVLRRDKLRIILLQLLIVFTPQNLNRPASMTLVALFLQASAAMTVSREGNTSLTVSPEETTSLTVSPEGNTSLTVSPEENTSLTTSSEAQAQASEDSDGLMITTRARLPNRGQNDPLRILKSISDYNETFSRSEHAEVSGTLLTETEEQVERNNLTFMTLGQTHMGDTVNSSNFTRSSITNIRLTDQSMINGLEQGTRCNINTSTETTQSHQTNWPPCSRDESTTVPVPMNSDLLYLDTSNVSKLDTKAPDVLRVNSFQSSTSATVTVDWWLTETQSGQFSCGQRCGEDPSYPCSCDEKCLVYKTCCPDLAEFCPTLFKRALVKFGNLMSASVHCDETSVVMLVNSCPSSLREVDGLLSQDDSSFGLTSPGHLSVRSPSEEDSLNIISLPEILSNAPVTDYSTGIMYTNISIFECNRENSISAWNQTANRAATAWNTQIGTLNKQIPSRMINAQQTLDLGTFSYVPPHSHPVSAGSLCYNDRVRGCIDKLSRELGIEQLVCDTSVNEYYSQRSTVRRMSNHDPRLASRVCSRCLSDYQESTARGSRYFLSGFKVLVSLSESPGRVHYSVHEEGRRQHRPVPWWSWECSVQDLVGQRSDTPCHVLECDPRFLITPEGSCRKAVEVLITIEHQLVVMGKKCTIEPEALVEAIRCYLLAYHKLKSTQKPIRFYRGIHPRGNVSVIGTRMEMYFVPQDYDSYMVDLFHMYRTLPPAMMTFARQLCAENETKLREKRIQTHGNVRIRKSQGLPENISVQGDDHLNYLQLTHDLSDVDPADCVKITYCLQLSLSLPDAMNCDVFRKTLIYTNETTLTSLDSVAAQEYMACLGEGSVGRQSTGSALSSTNLLIIILTMPTLLKTPTII